MKILFLTPWYPDERNPNHGVFVRDQALLINRDHEVWVVSSKIDYSRFAFSSLTRKDSTFQGIKESRLLVRRSLPVFNQFNFFLQIIQETWKIARQFRPDIIHGNIGYPGAFWSWAISVILKIPYVVTEHTRITNNFRSGIHKQLTLFGLRKASVLIGVSRWHADEITAYTGKETQVVPNVIRFEKFPAVRVAPAIDEFQIGFLGGLATDVKGLDLLLRAAASLVQKFKLHIGGEGRLLQYYKNVAKELNIEHCCVFYGSIPHEEINSFMQRLHFFVSASRSETFGIAMVEALACGLPVVATDSGGSKEFVTPENGLIVPAENVELLGAGIAWMMRNYSVFDGQVIRSQVITKFSQESFLDKIEALYRATVVRNND